MFLSLQLVTLDLTASSDCTDTIEEYQFVTRRYQGDVKKFEYVKVIYTKSILVHSNHLAEYVKKIFNASHM